MKKFDDVWRDWYRRLYTRYVQSRWTRGRADSRALGQPDVARRMSAGLLVVSRRTERDDQ